MPLMPAPPMPMKCALLKAGAVDVLSGAAMALSCAQLICV